jgi:glutaredoxin 2
MMQSVAVDSIVVFTILQNITCVIGLWFGEAINNAWREFANME